MSRTGNPANLRSTALLLACVLPAATAREATAQEGFLRPVTAADLKSLRSLDRSLLPAHSDHVTIEAGQVFRLVAQNQPSLLLVPVRFAHGEPSLIDASGSLAYRDRCGVFVLPETGPQVFVFTVTGQDDWAVDQCSKLEAVRRQPHNGPHPALTLTYSTFAPPRFEDRWFVTLTWDEAHATYRRSGMTEADAAR